MKRDMDLIRELMLKLETYPKDKDDVVPIDGNTPDIQLEGYTADQITLHLELLYEAGLINSNGAEARDGIYFYRLSWDGYDFLDSVRSPDVWDKTKKVAAAAGGFTVDLLVATAKTYLEAKIKGLIGG